MQAYLLTRHGKPSVLQALERPDPVPGPDQVRVQIRTIGMNFAEVQSRKGLYEWAPKLPYIPGMEACGIIDRVGSGASRFQTGERVIVAAQNGCYAEKTVVPAPQVLPALPAYSDAENAAFAVNFMTAWVALFELARLRPADTVLVQAAAGGVGTAAVQLAKKFGCAVYGTAGSDEKVDFLHTLGVHGAINYRREDFPAAFRKFTGGPGADVILEVVGGEVYRQSLRLLKPFGRIVVMGFASLDLHKWNPVSWWRTWRALPRAAIPRLARHSCGVLSSHLGYLLSDPAVLRPVWTNLTEYVTRHGIRPVIGHTFDFQDLPAAQALMESRRSRGKIVIRTGASGAESGPSPAPEQG